MHRQPLFVITENDFEFTGLFKKITDGECPYFHLVRSVSSSIMLVLLICVLRIFLDYRPSLNTSHPSPH
jgi:hypothetical protein